jgi:hypothetical protein
MPQTKAITENEKGKHSKSQEVIYEVAGSHILQGHDWERVVYLELSPRNISRFEGITRRVP